MRDGCVVVVSICFAPISFECILPGPASQKPYWMQSHPGTVHIGAGFYPVAPVTAVSSHAACYGLRSAPCNVAGKWWRDTSHVKQSEQAGEPRGANVERAGGERGQFLPSTARLAVWSWERWARRPPPGEGRTLADPVVLHPRCHGCAVDVVGFERRLECCPEDDNFSAVGEGENEG